ncbi:endolytic transglycosylase MltG [Lacimonas salitolerans]|uniref:Endolytic murein transglycosylase n=1 Tax=Lacimonas salitolerans TaxID=1323750 RepID=A0ABW4EDI7_9RHOB
MWRSIASNGITFLIVALFLMAGLILWGQREYTAQGPTETSVCVRVPSGGTMSEVSRDLEAQGVITNGTVFRLGADYTDKTQRLKAGSFLVPESASMAEIVDIVTRGGASTCGTEVVYRIGINRMQVVVRELDPGTGRYVENAAFVPGEDEVPETYTQVRAQGDTRYRVALAEGVTSWQVIEELKDVEVLSGEVAEVPPEGSLAPDSYEVRVGDERSRLVEQMQQRQQTILSAAWEGRVDGLPLASPEEVLILASIIEKETGTPDERGVVASVFVNRLERGMRLQTDPTVIYGITQGEGILGRGLRQSELRAATPWNTYVIEGLPPTPIANPGRASIEAAVNPDDTDFVFFVARTLDPKDGHNFAVTLDEHNRNVAAYRRLEAERN